MAVEELGIRLRADGVVEATNGVALSGRAVDELGKKLDAAAQQSQALDTGTRNAAAGAQVLGGAARVLASELGNVLPFPGQLNGALAGMGEQGAASLGGLSAGALALGSAFVVLTAIGAVLVAAYTNGSREAQEYTKQLILTGNAAGTTRSQLADYARSIDATIGTQGEAAAALAAMVASAQVGANNLEQFAEVAVRMDRVLGQSIEQTTKTFADLGREPLKASISLNESTNYLTRSIYDQIKALMEQGRESEAASVAQKAYADAMGPRLKALEANLGTFERAWRSVKSAAAEAWDAILNVGREQTNKQRIESINKQLEALDSRKSQNPALTAARRAALVEQRDALIETEALAKRSATAQATEAAAVRDYIAVQEQKKKSAGGATAADPYARLNDQIAKRLGLAQAELDSGQKLSEADRFRIEMLREIDEIEKKIGRTKADQLRQRAESTAIAIRETETQRRENKEAEAIARAGAAAREAERQAAVRQVATLQQQRDSLAAETAEIGMSTEAILQRRQAVLDAQIADVQARLTRISGLPAYTEEAVALQQQIALLQEMKVLRAQNADKQSRQAEADEHKRRTDGIAQSITDGFFQGKRGAATVMENFRRELQTAFARTVLQPRIQALADSGNDLLGSIIKGAAGLFGGGLSIDASGAGQGGGILGSGSAILPGVLRGGGATGTNELERDMITLVHKGEAIVPKAYNPDAGGRGGRGGGGNVTFAPNIHIDSRTDKAEIMRMVQGAMTQANAQLLEMMERRQA
jgi:phage-related minor tail protein